MTVTIKNNINIKQNHEKKKATCDRRTTCVLRGILRNLQPDWPAWTTTGHPLAFTFAMVKCHECKIHCLRHDQVGGGASPPSCLHSVAWVAMGPAFWSGKEKTWWCLRVEVVLQIPGCALSHGGRYVFIYLFLFIPLFWSFLLQVLVRGGQIDPSVLHAPDPREQDNFIDVKLDEAWAPTLKPSLEIPSDILLHADIPPKITILHMT